MWLVGHKNIMKPINDHFYIKLLLSHKSYFSKIFLSCVFLKIKHRKSDIVSLFYLCSQHLHINDSYILLFIYENLVKNIFNFINTENMIISLKI